MLTSVTSECPSPIESHEARVTAVIVRSLTHPLFIGYLILALSISAYMYPNGLNTRQIASDGWGYYLYLPAAFIYGDLEFSFLNQPDLPPALAQYRLEDGSWQGLSPTG